jgi:hypothetical protein
MWRVTCLFADQGIWDTLALIPNFNTTHIIDALNDPSHNRGNIQWEPTIFCGNVSEDMGFPQSSKFYLAQ